MAYLTVAVLVLTVIFLAVHQIRGSGRILQRWLRPAKRREMDEQDGHQISSRTLNGHAAQPKIMTPDQTTSEEETTPKASATNGGADVPAFSLNENPLSGEQERLQPVTEGNAPMFPAANGIQRAQPTPAFKSSSVSPGAQNGSTGLMAPPPRPSLKPPQISASALRVPSTGPLPNRGPPANSQQRASGGLTVNGVVATSNSRGKVLLAPGHSPMDWAALTRKGNLSGVNTFQRVTPSVLKSMTGRKGKPAWSSWQGKVYNLTPYIPFHPGGEAEIMKAAGRDGTKLFMDVHPWVNWENMLGTCLVGVLVPEDYGNGDTGASSLEDID